MKKVIILLFPLVLFSKPVKIEEILTEKSSFRLDGTVSYMNIQQNSSSISPISYQTNNGDFVTIPTYLGNNSINQDYLNHNLSLRYGVSKKMVVLSVLKIDAFLMEQMLIILHNFLCIKKLFKA